MAARALASLTVTFGMVSIPVKLYTATQAQGGYFVQSAARRPAVRG